MIIKDRRWGYDIFVDVCCEACSTYNCYVAKPGDSDDVEKWICGTREKHGCPNKPEVKE